MAVHFLPHLFARNRKAAGTFALRGNRPIEVTVMLFKTTTSLAFATACLTAVATMPAHAQMAGSYGSSGTEVVTNGPQTNPGDASSSWSARRNVTESQQYDRLLETNRGFRQARMRKECGPISDPQLRQDCLASFNQDEPYAGSSTPRRSDRSESGR
jgi:hypothetical protein